MQLEWQVYAVGVVVGTCFLAALAGIVLKLRGGRQDRPETSKEREPVAVEIHLDRTRFPEALWPLIPYAERWGSADDVERLALIRAASAEEKADLLAAVERHRTALMRWLETTDVTASDDWTAMAFMETAAAEIEALENGTD